MLPLSFVKYTNLLQVSLLFLNRNSKEIHKTYKRHHHDFAKNIRGRRKMRSTRAAATHSSKAKTQTTHTLLHTYFQLSIITDVCLFPPDILRKMMFINNKQLPNHFIFYGVYITVYVYAYAYLQREQNQQLKAKSLRCSFSYLLRGFSL